MTPQEWTAFQDALTPEQAAALTVYGEAKNQSVSGLQAVLSVIRNRVKVGRFGSGWKGVIFKPWQFSCWNEGDPNRAQLLQLGFQLIGKTERTQNAVFDVCVWLAAQMVEGKYLSNVSDSTHYYAPAIVDTPAWAKSPAVRRTVVGSHVFYGNVR